MRTNSRVPRQEFWRGVLQRQRRSGLSIHRFCQKEGLAVATFFLWKRRLGASRERVPALVSFAPVRVEGEALTTSAAGSLEILLPHERRIRLTGTVDRQQLATVLAALAQ